MEKDYLILKRASASRPLGEWKDDDFDVLANGVVVGRIMKANAAPVGSPWMWTLAFGYQRPHADPRLRADERGRDGGVRQELADMGWPYRLPKRSFEAFTRLADRPLVTDRAMEAWYHPSIA
jgi:hypothetical protein